MHIGRTIPPAAAPIYMRDIISGLCGIIRGQKECKRFKSELKNYFGVKHCFLVSSGKAALTIILRALHAIHPERNEVLIPAFICYSVPSAIVRAGLKIRLCDTDPDTLDFNFAQLKKILTQTKPAIQNSKFLPREIHASNSVTHLTGAKLLAVVSPHLFGLPADIEKIQEMVKDPDVTIVEDAAQVLGTEWNNRKLGTIGDVSFFSLGRGKALSTVEGGIILTNKDNLSENIRKELNDISEYTLGEKIILIINAVIINIFMRPSLFWFPKSLLFLKLGDTIYDSGFKIKKMSSFQAGLANDWEDKLTKFIKMRSANSRYWKSCFQPSPNSQLATNSSNLPASSFQLPANISDIDSFLRFPLRVDNPKIRKNILEKSKQMGLGIMFTYPDSVDGIKELKDDFQKQAFPGAKAMASKLITLPVHPFVSENDKVQIIKHIEKYC